MAVPTLTPSSQTSRITLPTGSSPSDIEDNTELPFQIYSHTTVAIAGVSQTTAMFSQYFCTGAANQVSYTFKKVGGDVLDLEITTGSVEYYFDVLADQNIEQQLACRGALDFDKSSYYIDLDFECDQEEKENVFYDIYGSVTEPEICQD